MEERNEEEDNQETSKPELTEENAESGHDDLDSDSDDGMEVDNFEDAKSSEKENDSELVDSDVNVEAAELTSSDVDMSDESDIKNDPSSGAESNPYSPIESAVSPKKEFDDEETFALEIKDGKEDSGDEDVNEGGDGDDKTNKTSSDTVDPCSNQAKSTDKMETDVGEENPSNDPSTENLNETGEVGRIRSPKLEDVKMEDLENEKPEEEKSTESEKNKKQTLPDENESKEVKEELIENDSQSEAVPENDTQSNTNDGISEPVAAIASPSNEPKEEKFPASVSDAERELNDSELSNDCSDFIGFDSTIINETLQIYEMLQENHEELLKSLQSVKTKNLDDTATSIDSHPTTEAIPPTTSTISDQISPVTVLNAAHEISNEDRNTDEQSANSKRIKKKRKFFDEFDESEGEPPKRLHLMKERESNSTIDNSSSENKENLISSEKHSIKDDTLCDSSATSSALASSTPNPPRVESKGKFDITCSDFKEPFKYGWRREVVYRFISDDGRKRSADVSYFTPQGKKLRSIKQINEHMPSDGSLSIKNFTFSKELIFNNRESELEVIRFTKKMEMELLTNESGLGDNLVDGKLGVEAVSSIIDRKLGIEPISGKDQLKADAAKKVPSSKKKDTSNKSKSGVKNQSLQGFESTTPVAKLKSSKKNKTLDTDAEETSNATPKLAMPKILLRGPSVNSNSVQKSMTTKPAGMKIKIAPSKSNNQKTAAKKSSSKSKSDKSSKSQKDKRDRSGAGDLEAGALNAEWKASDQRSISPSEKSAISSSLSSKSNEGMPACSISCPSALGTIPTLQCTICLCLFHFQCCGLDADRAIYGYVCKNCRMCERKKENGQSIYKTIQRTCYSPKRLYPVDHYESLVVSVNNTDSSAVAKNTKIVDGVTTWLPSSSNIHLSANSLKNSSSILPKNAAATSSSSASSPVDAEAPLVQGVLELEGRRYVIVPKQSVLSVSPNANAMFIQNHANTCEKNTSGVSRRGNGDVPNTLLVDPKDVNSAGVVLVPVHPPNCAAVSPQQYPTSRYHSSVCNANNRAKYLVELNAYSPYQTNTCNSFNGRSPNETSEICRSVDFQSSFTLSNIARIYDPLLMSLKYLTVRDLLRVSVTSKFLNRVASDPYLWKTVRLRNSQVYDWNGFAKTLQKYGTKRLDMRKMLGSNVPDDLVKMWNNFLEVIPTITSLEHIDFSRAPTSVVDNVAASCSNLSVINALYLKNGSLQLENFAKLKNLTKLRLKGVSGIQLERPEQRLQFINKDNLREISLTSIRNLDMDLIEIISEATNLVTLELGECAKLPAEFANQTLSKLTKLEKLRLEKLQDLAPKYDFLNVIKDMSTLKYLELINVEVKEGFDDALAACKNLDHFLIIPTYVSQSATTNQLIINGIEKLSDTMKCFVWGLTTELLKVTDLFMEQWQVQKGNNSASVKKAVGDSIPIRKSVDKVASDGDTAPTHVDILPVPKLEKTLTTLLPNTRVKVIKIPFQMTWRQCLSECLK